MDKLDAQDENIGEPFNQADFEKITLTFLPNEVGDIKLTFSKELTSIVIPKEVAINMALSILQATQDTSDSNCTIQ